MNEQGIEIVANTPEQFAQFLQQELAKWLAQYGTLDAVIAHAGEIPGVVGENLRAALDWLPQGKRLLTVKTDCALPLAPTDLTFGPADADRLHELFSRWGFQSLLAGVESATSRQGVLL